MNNTISAGIIAEYADDLHISKVAVKKIHDIKDIRITQAVRNILPNAKIIIAACLSYNSPGEGNILQYTRANYYRVLSKMLHKLAKRIKTHICETRTDSEVFRTSVNSVLNDKLAAVECGLGTFCTNHLVCVEGSGIKTILGELIMDIDCETEPVIPTKICSDCGLCLKSCPTGALTVDGVDKSRCIQHNSGITDFNEELIEVWGMRFFGCSDCIQCCPINHFSPQSPLDTTQLTGYIGTDFDMNNLFVFNRGDYKAAFRANQLAATWMEEIVHPRNVLIALHNAGRDDLVAKYKSQAENYGWNEDEIQYLKKWCDILLNRSKK